jgi:hypothetical protein
MDIDGIEIGKLSESLSISRLALEAHRLENLISVLLATRIIEKKENYENCFKEIKGLVLGRLIKRLLYEFDIPAYWQEELDNALWFRNKLIHRISDDVSYVILKHGNSAKLVEELYEIYGYFKETSEYIESLVFKWLDEKGITKEKMQTVVQKLIKNANHRETEFAQTSG